MLLGSMPGSQMGIKNSKLLAKWRLSSHVCNHLYTFSIELSRSLRTLYIRTVNILSC